MLYISQKHAPPCLKLLFVHPLPTTSYIPLSIHGHPGYCSISVATGRLLIHISNDETCKNVLSDGKAAVFTTKEPEW